MLTDHEKEMLADIVETWIDADAPLSGRFSYAKVQALLDKLGVTNDHIAAYFKRLGAK